MAQLDKFIDMTGKMTSQEVLQENINQIIDELNRQSAQTDSIQNNLSIVGYGSLALPWSGAALGATPTFANVPVTATPGYFVMGFMTRSDIPDQVFSMPYFESLQNGAGDVTVSKQIYMGLDTTAGLFYAKGYFYTAGAPLTFNISYYLIEQPPNVKSS